MLQRTNLRMYVWSLGLVAASVGAAGAVGACSGSSDGSDGSGAGGSGDASTRDGSGGSVGSSGGSGGGSGSTDGGSGGGGSGGDGGITLSDGGAGGTGAGSDAATAVFPCGTVPVGDTSAEATYPTGGRTLYVSPSGKDDGNTGTSAASPFATLQKAASETKPGDTVLVGDGTYDVGAGLYALDIPTSGTASAWIVYRAAPGAHPRINSQYWAAINGTGVSYVVVDGFEIQGNRTSITKAYATANPMQPETSGNGISFTRSHHVVIRNNVVHDCSGGGIGGVSCDSMIAEHNVTYLNAYWSVYGASGISFYESEDMDGVGVDAGAGAGAAPKIVVRDNVSYGNEEFLDCSCSGNTAITDGNGIIIDDNQHTQDGHPELAYRGRTLVVNNVAYGNGGSGIHAFASSHVDIVFNTAYMNNHSPAIDEGQIFSQGGKDNNVLDNVMWAAAGKVASSSSANTTTVYDYNLYFNGTMSAPGPHDLSGVDPELASVTCEDFRLTAGSPAIDSAGSTLAPTLDLLNTARPSGAGFDRGAYEFVR